MLLVTVGLCEGAHALGEVSLGASHFSQGPATFEGAGRARDGLLLFRGRVGGGAERFFYRGLEGLSVGLVGRIKAGL